LILFAFSLLFGVMSKQIGMAVANGLETANRLEALLASENGRHLMSQMTVEPRQLMNELAEPFLWPISVLVRRSGARGITDYAAADRRFIRFLCIQLYFNMVHALLAAAAVVTLALSIDS